MCVFVLIWACVYTGAYAEGLWEGFTESSWGSGGRCEPPPPPPPPSVVRGRVPEDFEINAFQRLRTPVSLTFESHCYTKIDDIFFIHSHPHHFQLNEVVPADHTLWHKKSQSQLMNCPVLSLVLHPNLMWGRLSVFLTLEIVLHCDPWPKEVVEHPQAICASLPERSEVHACLTHCIHPEIATLLLP